MRAKRLRTARSISSVTSRLRPLTSIFTSAPFVELREDTDATPIAAIASACWPVARSAITPERASATAETRSQPPACSAAAQAERVAPVVITSSTKTRRSGPRAGTRPCGGRVEPALAAAADLARPVARGAGNRRAMSDRAGEPAPRAISAAGSKPRVRVGAPAIAGTGIRTPAPGSQLGDRRDRARGLGRQRDPARELQRRDQCSAAPPVAGGRRTRHRSPRPRRRSESPAPGFGAIATDDRVAGRRRPSRSRRAEGAARVASRRSIARASSRAAHAWRTAVRASAPIACTIPARPAEPWRRSVEDDALDGARTRPRSRSRPAPCQARYRGP